MAPVGRYLRSLEGGLLAFRCPGCEENHAVRVSGDGEGPRWSYNGNPGKPTFQPSILVRSGHYAKHFDAEKDECWCIYNALKRAAGEPESGFNCEVCHSFVTDGRIQFLGDCTHALAGQTVPLPAFDSEPTPYARFRMALRRNAERK